jgi:hypothetical protein
MQINATGPVVMVWNSKSKIKYASLVEITHQSIPLVTSLDEKHSIFSYPLTWLVSLQYYAY